MSTTTNSSTALLTEHLRHTPVSLIDDVINSINTIGYKAIDWVEQGLLRTPLSNLGFPDPVSSKGDQGEEDVEEKVRREIENGVHQFETLLEATIDKNFDKMEIFALRSIIAIPDDLKDWIRLRHYEGLNFLLPPDAPTLESITLQRRKFQESQRLHRLLQAEAARNAALITQLRSHLVPASHAQIEPKIEPSDTTDAAMSDASLPPAHPAFAFLTQKADLPASSAATPLSTTTAFALTQLPAMKALLADLRPALAALSSRQPEQQQQQRDAAAVEEEMDKKSFRLQRVEYVESQTRRLHENVRGLELGPMGEVRDGEWQERGRRVGWGEVEALERVMGMIAGEGMDES